jgi:Lon protease-like protein
MELPLFPLGVVLFPGGLLPLRVFETRYVDMTRDCVKTGKPFGVCLIREGREVGAPAVPEPIGCIARIAHWDVEQLGLMSVKAVGEGRFRVNATRTNSQGLVIGEVEALPAEEAPAVPAEFSGCADLVRKAVEAAGTEAFAEPFRFDDAAWVGYRLAEILPLPMAARQGLLEMDAPLARLALLYRLLSGASASGGQ